MGEPTVTLGIGKPWSVYRELRGSRDPLNLSRAQSTGPRDQGVSPVSEGSSTEGNTPVTTESAAGSNAPSPNPVTQSAPAPAPQQPAFKAEDLATLTTAIASLPETIARSVKEAIGTPVPPAQPATAAKPETDTDKGAAGSGTHTAEKGSAAPAGKPGNKTFKDWWFGS